MAVWTPDDEEHCGGWNGHHGTKAWCEDNGEWKPGCWRPQMEDNARRHHNNTTSTIKQDESLLYVHVPVFSPFISLNKNEHYPPPGSHHQDFTRHTQQPWSQTWAAILGDGFIFDLYPLISRNSFSFTSGPQFNMIVGLMMGDGPL